MFRVYKKEKKTPLGGLTITVAEMVVDGYDGGGDCRSLCIVM